MCHLHRQNSLLLIYAHNALYTYEYNGLQGYHSQRIFVFISIISIPFDDISTLWFDHDCAIYIDKIFVDVHGTNKMVRDEWLTTNVLIIYFSLE